jgi:hypothetical protein
MNRLQLLATGIAIMAMTTTWAEEKEKPKLPVTAELTGETKYVLDLDGKTVEEFEKALKPDKQQLAKLPNPPKVDLKLVLKNSTDKDVQIYGKGDPVKIDLTLSGPGAHSVKPGLAMTMEFRMPQAVKIEAGKTLELPITMLSSGKRGVSMNHYWTKAGDYELVATFKTGINPAPKDTKADASGFGPISIVSEKLKIEVTEKK